MTPPEKLARQKRTLRWLIVVLAVGGILVAVLATKMPAPLRFFLAATDLVAAGFLWVALRQQSEKK